MLWVVILAGQPLDVIHGHEVAGAEGLCDSPYRVRTPDRSPVGDDGAVAGSDDPEPPEIDMVFEGDVTEPVHVPIAAVPGDPGAPDTDVKAPEPEFHTVGRDPLGQVAGAMSDTVAHLRAQRLESRAAAIGTGRGSNHDHAIERMAQVVQATPVDIDVVLGLLTDGTVRSATNLRLTGEPGVRNGVVLFDGYLRLRRPPTRRRIELRVYPTASGNLTVLELLPRRDWMPQTKRYLRSGVPAITDLTDRIEGVPGT